MLPPQKKTRKDAPPAPAPRPPQAPAVWKPAFAPGANAVLEAPAHSGLPRRATVSIVAVHHATQGYDVVVTSAGSGGRTGMLAGVPEQYLRREHVLVHSKNCHNTELAELLSRFVFDVPVFQRRYCWGSAQWDALWEDLVQAHGKHKTHALGRLMVTTSRASPSRTTVCDGQQRLTSVLLLLSAIRDTSEALASAAAAAAPAASQLTQRCNALLCHDVREMDRWAAMQGGGGRGGACEAGQVLPFLRLVPTFDDRLAFNAAMVGERLDAFRLPPAPRHSVEARTPRDGQPSLITQAKLCFMHHLAAHLGIRSDDGKGGAKRDAKAEARVQELGSVLDSAVHRLTFIFFEVADNEVEGNAQGSGPGATQVLYENLAVREQMLTRVLYVPRPGVGMSAADLVRNLVLSHFADEASIHRAYQRYWLPMEQSCGGTAASLEVMLAAFLEREGFAAPQHDHEAFALHARFTAWLDKRLEGVGEDKGEKEGEEGRGDGESRALVVCGALENLLRFAVEGGWRERGGQGAEQTHGRDHDGRNGEGAKGVGMVAPVEDLERVFCFRSSEQQQRQQPRPHQ